MNRRTSNLATQTRWLPSIRRSRLKSAPSRCRQSDRTFAAGGRLNRPYCAWMPDSLMIGHHFSISAFWKAARPSGVCCSREATSRPSSVKRARTDGFGKRLHHRLVESGYDVFRRAFRCEQSEPSGHIKPGDTGLIRGRNVRHRRRSLGRKIGDRLDFCRHGSAAAPPRPARPKVNLAGYQVGHGGSCATIRNEVDFLPGQFFEHSTPVTFAAAF